jgi:hypothetical protein
MADHSKYFDVFTAPDMSIDVRDQENFLNNKHSEYAEKLMKIENALDVEFDRLHEEFKESKETEEYYRNFMALRSMVYNMVIVPMELSKGFVYDFIRWVNDLEDAVVKENRDIGDTELIKIFIATYDHMVRTVYISFVNILMRIEFYKKTLYKSPLIAVWLKFTGRFSIAVSEAYEILKRTCHHNLDKIHLNSGLPGVTDDKNNAREQDYPCFCDTLCYYTAPQLLFMYQCNANNINLWRRTLACVVQEFDEDRLLDNIEVLLNTGEESTRNNARKFVQAYIRTVPDQCTESADAPCKLFFAANDENIAPCVDNAFSVRYTELMKYRIITKKRKISVDREQEECTSSKKVKDA